MFIPVSSYLLWQFLWFEVWFCLFFMACWDSLGYNGGGLNEPPFCYLPNNSCKAPS